MSNKIITSFMSRRIEGRHHEIILLLEDGSRCRVYEWHYKVGVPAPDLSPWFTFEVVSGEPLQLVLKGTAEDDKHVTIIGSQSDWSAFLAYRRWRWKALVLYEFCMHGAVADRCEQPRCAETVLELLADEG